MEQTDKQVYQWQVKKGSVLLFREEHKIHLGLDTDASASCLLTEADTEDVVSILTALAGAIWKDPDFVKEPYAGRLFRTDDSNGRTYWDLAPSRLSVGFNESEDAVEIDCSGDPVLLLPVNYAVELIQVLTHYQKQFGA
ncbi:hypothetical protein [Flaviaesturariibacter aridisoli]|uniref:Uncharacterized protein n=1 Tax=Flaviaesturariibacter aridisoli TaxID=2545761 RepID=A0A4R4DUW6_9BACT|nr:hypothetical protein [Flaviaesturariibacter aridisoli]TCZ66927.1 hypothetical protein E0486_16400 [Flaviaesturariibacter aridisoli]